MPGLHVPLRCVYNPIQVMCVIPYTCKFLWEYIIVIDLLYLPLPWLYKCSIGTSAIGFRIRSCHKFHCTKYVCFSAGDFSSGPVQIPKPVSKAGESVNLPK